jgi:hypothetical protein
MTYLRVATRSKAWVCGRSLAGIAGARVLRRADHSSRGVLASVWCVCDREVWTIRRPRPNRAIDPLEEEEFKSLKGYCSLVTRFDNKIQKHSQEQLRDLPQLYEVTGCAVIHPRKQKRIL